MAPWVCFLLLVCYGEYTDAIHRDKLRARQVWMRDLTQWMEARTEQRFKLEDTKVSFSEFAEANDLQLPKDFHPFTIHDKAAPLPRVPY